MLGHSGQEMNGQSIDIGQVTETEANSHLLQAGDDVKISGQSIQLGDQDGGTTEQGVIHSRFKLGSITPGPGLDLDKFGDDISAIAFQKILGQSIP